MSQSTPPTVARAHSPGRWLPWLLLAAGALLLLAVVAVLFFLDPWLRRTLEKQVATASQGRYELRIQALETRLWTRSITLGGVQLLTTSTAAPDTAALPDLRLDLGKLQVTGIGLMAALRRQVVPVESLVLDSVYVRLGSLPASSKEKKPLHARLPMGLPGLHLNYLALHNVRARYGSLQRAEAQLDRASLQVHDLLLSAAGAADTTRLAYAKQVAFKVNSVLARAPGHVVRLRHGSFSSDSSRLALRGLRVAPLQAISNQRTRAARLDIALPWLELRGLRAARLTRGTLQADSLLLRDSRLALTLPAVAPPPPHELLAPYLPHVRLAGLRLTGARLRIADQDRDPAAQDIRLTASDIHLAAQTYNAPGYLYHARAWTLHTGRARALLDAPYYRLATRSLQADTRRGELLLRTITLIPTMSAAALARRKGHQAAHVTLQLSQLRVQGLAFAALLRRGSVLAERIDVRGGQIITTSDGRFATNPALSVATPDAIGRLPFRVNVRQLRLAEADIQLVYRSPRSPQPGMMRIGELTATLHNISNDPRRMDAAHPMTGKATGRLQQCAVRVVLRANLLDPRGCHTLQGRFSATPLAMLNPMLLPTQGLYFQKGQIEGIRFQMQLNRKWAHGTMWAEYEDLKVVLLNRQNERGVLHRIKTTLVNGLFLRDSNPRRPGQPLKPGEMTSERELRYSVFTLWRQGIVSGMLHSAGVPGPLARRLSKGQQ